MRADNDDIEYDDADRPTYEGRLFTGTVVEIYANSVVATEIDFKRVGVTASAGSTSLNGTLGLAGGGVLDVGHLCEPTEGRRRGRIDSPGPVGVLLLVEGAKVDADGGVAVIVGGEVTSAGRAESSPGCPGKVSYQVGSLLVTVSFPPKPRI